MKPICGLLIVIALTLITTVSASPSLTVHLIDSKTLHPLTGATVILCEHPDCQSGSSPAYIDNNAYIFTNSNSTENLLYGREKNTI